MAWLGAFADDTPEMRRNEMTTRLVEMSREEARAIAESGVLILPLGSTEQHGPHLPVGTDGLCSELVASQAAASVSAHIPTAVAPTLWFGSSAHHLPFGATISLRSQTLLSVLMDIGTSLAESGFRRLFMVNGHGGNHELMLVAAHDLALSTKIRVGACSWWAVALDVLTPEHREAVHRIPGHAGAFETSLIQAIDPQLVRSEPPSRKVTGEYTNTWARRSAGRSEDPQSWLETDGYSDDPSAGSADLGAHFLRAGTEAVVAAVENFLRATP